MKRRILTMALMLTIGSATAALAQGGGGGGGGQNRAAQRMAAMLQGITLTPTQQTSIDSINAAYQTQMPAFTPGQRPDSAQMAQRRELSTRRDAAIRNLLTPDQQKVWDHNLEVMRQNMPQRP